MKRLSQKGFAPAEVVLIVVIVALIGFVGWFVWHSSQQTKATLDAASKSAQSSPDKTSKKSVTPSPSVSGGGNAGFTKYLVLKEWGVEIPYTSTDALSYKIAGKSAQVASAELADKYGCTGYGSGSIGRSTGDEPDPQYDTTVADAYSSHPDSYVKVGDYYYKFVHDQAMCSDSVTPAAQNAANDFLKSILPNLQSI